MRSLFVLVYMSINRTILLYIFNTGSGGWAVDRA